MATGRATAQSFGLSGSSEFLFTKGPPEARIDTFRGRLDSVVRAPAQAHGFNPVCSLVLIREKGMLFRYTVIT